MLGLLRAKTRGSRRGRAASVGPDLGCILSRLLDQFQTLRGFALGIKARDPERCAKIAAARRGRKMPKALLRKLVALRKGSRMSDEARRKMSEAQRRRGARPPNAGVPWSAQEDEWLRTLPTAEVVRRTGRTKSAVYNRRADWGCRTGEREDRISKRAPSLKPRSRPIRAATDPFLVPSLPQWAVEVQPASMQLTRPQAREAAGPYVADRHENCLL